ncbi:hypothetical protein AAFF_G00082700 [Aldrovandia affinis]|uniref:Uncharacterized protein n=1 Tax=Aldrovandia affinis TaxID=143900 RepID=A0AAD7RXA2_9TELE|nr:hypothetical protein AAFF_G00082700 [Aldrovandia affinis]
MHHAVVQNAETDPQRSPSLPSRRSVHRLRQRASSEAGLRGQCGRQGALCAWRTRPGPEPPLGAGPLGLQEPLCTSARSGRLRLPLVSMTSRRGGEGRRDKAITKQDGEHGIAEPSRLSRTSMSGAAPWDAQSALSVTPTTEGKSNKQARQTEQPSSRVHHRHSDRGDAEPVIDFRCGVTAQLGGRRRGNSHGRNAFEPTGFHRQC